MNRRDFLKHVGYAAAGVGVLSGAPMIVPAEVVGRGSRPAPSNRITMAAIGNGWMGASNISGFLNIDDVQMIAVCDVFAPNLENGIRKINERYGNSDCAGFRDFRELFERDDIDAVMIATPDHSHSIPAILAAHKGIDIYGEKPFSRTVAEGRAMVNAVKRQGRIWQTGSWQRSRDNFRQGVELVRNGRIGKVSHVDVGYRGGIIDFEKTADRWRPEPVEEGLDYDLWLGSAPWQPYSPARVHKNWRNVLDYGGGMLTDWVGHHLDIAHWGLDKDHTGPVLIEAKGTFEPGFYDVPATFDVMCTYADGVRIRISDSLPSGTRFHGENGRWIHVDRGSIKANPSDLLNENIGPEEIRLVRSNDHYQNFIDCVKSRQETLTPAETGHRSASVGNLALISIQVGRAIRWNPETETIINDEVASRYLTREMRAPWTLAV